MGIVHSPLPCSFCGKSDEFLEHLFVHCKISGHFWLVVAKWFKDYFNNYITFGFLATYIILRSSVSKLPSSVKVLISNPPFHYFH